MSEEKKKHSENPEEAECVFPVSGQVDDLAEMSDTEIEEEIGEESDSMEDTVYDWAKCLISAVVGVVLIFTFLVRLVGVSGGSMQNTLYTGDRLLVLNPIFCDFKQGDIVVANAYNAQLDETIIKRIIAVGGQTVDIDFVTGTVYVDGKPLDEPYVKEPTYTTDGTVFPLTLAEDEFFLMGDNRNRSTDSRSTLLGPVDKGYLQGEAVFLLIPGKTAETEKMDWSRFGFIE